MNYSITTCLGISLGLGWYGNPKHWFVSLFKKKNKKVNSRFNNNQLILSTPFAQELTIMNIIMSSIKMICHRIRIKGSTPLTECKNFKIKIFRTLSSVWVKNTTTTTTVYYIVCVPLNESANQKPPASLEVFKSTVSVLWNKTVEQGFSVVFLNSFIVASNMSKFTKTLLSTRCGAFFISRRV